jgi:Cu-Zn family superoxide dismutase
LISNHSTFRIIIKQNYIMKKLAIVTTVMLLAIFTSCKEKAKEAEKEIEEEVTEVVEEVKTETSKEINFELEPKSDSKARGKVEFTETDGKVTMNAKIAGLSPGTHAIHIHEKADCSSADGKSTGGHWNPTMEPHGKWGDENGYHKGDIGNFEANDNGIGMVSITTDEWCIGCGDEKKDILGKAIIVHQGVDDFTSQPSGAAGARVSCGGIIQ